jgi:site-specific DNA recombinase
MKCSKCGSPIGGTTLNGKYRYYQCRGARPTATRGKVCDVGYIKANELEGSVWSRVLDMLSDPLTLLEKYGKEINQQPADTVALLTKQIEQLRKKLKTYPVKERNLYELLSHDDVTKRYVLEAVEKLKKERLNDEGQLTSLLASRKEANKADRFALKLSEVSLETMADLALEHIVGIDRLATINRKRSLLQRLRFKGVAERKTYQFGIILDGKIISSSTYENSFIEAEEFERKNPEISVEDLLDIKKQIPENTKFGQKVTKLKRDLVTIEQTSA